MMRTGVSSLGSAIHIDPSQKQPMTNRTITHDGLAFDHFRDNLDSFIEQGYANAFADRAGVTTNGDKLTVIVRAHGDIAREAENAFPTRLNGNPGMTSPAEHRHLDGNTPER
jgi:hypothetical protein